MASAFHQRCGFEFGNQSLYKKKKKKKRVRLPTNHLSLALIPQN